MIQSLSEPWNVLEVYNNVECIKDFDSFRVGVTPSYIKTLSWGIWEYHCPGRNWM